MNENNYSEIDHSWAVFQSHTYVNSEYSTRRFLSNQLHVLTTPVRAETRPENIARNYNRSRATIGRSAPLTRGSRPPRNPIGPPNFHYLRARPIPHCCISHLPARRMHNAKEALGFVRVPRGRARLNFAADAGTARAQVRVYTRPTPGRRCASRVSARASLRCENSRGGTRKRASRARCGSRARARIFGAGSGDEAV